MNRALLVLVLSEVVFCTVRALIPHHTPGDLRVYRAEGMALRNNIDISERFIALALRKSVTDAQERIHGAVVRRPMC